MLPIVSSILVSMMASQDHMPDLAARLAKLLFDRCNGNCELVTEIVKEISKLDFSESKSSTDVRNLSHFIVIPAIPFSPDPLFGTSPLCASSLTSRAAETPLAGKLRVAIGGAAESRQSSSPCSHSAVFRNSLRNPLREHICGSVAKPRQHPRSSPIAGPKQRERKNNRRKKVHDGNRSQNLPCHSRFASGTMSRRECLRSIGFATNVEFIGCRRSRAINRDDFCHAMRDGANSGQGCFSQEKCHSCNVLKGVSFSYFAHSSKRILTNRN